VNLATSLLAAAVVATGISAFASNPTRADVPASASPSASAVKPGTVAIKDFAYAPPTITVSAGATVTFKNVDSIAHTVSADDKSFDSGNMDQNGTWSHVFATAGTYKYTCAYHAFMHGTIVVK